jgi:glycosyltransferase involved in cell wall biosynthesis
MFPVEERRNLDVYRWEMADHATRVIVSSRDAWRDFGEFAPSATGKARVLSFVAQVPPEVYARDPAWVCAQYGLPQRFMHLPNQFWKHKNHQIVVRALRHVQAEHPEIRIVCTGNTNEYRNPLYFGQLLAAISEAGVREQMILLGLVPYAHLMALMRQAVAVLQPSLFEGWSTTVEEAKSLGKAVLLSDLPVHREQAPPAARYFDPHAPRALAAALVATFEEGRPGPDADLEAAARAGLPVRTRAYAKAFLKIVSEVSGKG